MRQVSRAVELGLGLLGVILVAVSSATAWASGGSQWCSGKVQNGNLVCTPQFCDPPTCSQEPGQILIWCSYHQVFHGYDYQYCSCNGGPEDDCCHTIVLLPNPGNPTPLPWAIGICDPNINCYVVGNCHVYTGPASGDAWATCHDTSEWE